MIHSHESSEHHVDADTVFECLNSKLNEFNNEEAINRDQVSVSVIYYLKKLLLVLNKEMMQQGFKERRRNKLTIHH